MAKGKAGRGGALSGRGAALSGRGAALSGRGAALSGRVAVLLLFALCAALAAAGLALVYVRKEFAQTPIAEEDNLSQVESLSQTVMNRDLVGDYPQTPEEVLLFYDQTTQLLYDPRVTAAAALAAAVNRQRLLFGDELLRLNDEGRQVENLIISRQRLAARNISVAGFSHMAEEYDPEDPDQCRINAVTHIDGDEDLYFVFYFQREEDGRWKIFTRESADQDFNPVSS